MVPPEPLERFARTTLGRVVYGAFFVSAAVALVAAFTLLSREVFRTDFVPLGEGYHWYPPIIALHIISNASITAGFLLLAGVMLWVGVKRSHDIAPAWLYDTILLLLVFDALAHFFTIVAIFQPMFWFMGYFRLATGVLAVAIAAFAARLAPILVRLPGPKVISLVQGQLEMDTDTIQTLIYRLSQRERELEELRNELQRGSARGHSGKE